MLSGIAVGGIAGGIAGALIGLGMPEFEGRSLRRKNQGRATSCFQSTCKNNRVADRAREILEPLRRPTHCHILRNASQSCDLNSVAYLPFRALNQCMQPGTTLSRLMGWANNLLLEVFGQYTPWPKVALRDYREIEKQGVDPIRA